MSNNGGDGHRNTEDEFFSERMSEARKSLFAILSEEVSFYFFEHTQRDTNFLI